MRRIRKASRGNRTRKWEKEIWRSQDRKEGRLSFQLRSRLSELSPQMIFSAVQMGFLKPDESVLDRMLEHCSGETPEKLQEISEENSLYLLSLLYCYGFFCNLPDRKRLDESFGMLQMVTDPARFFYSGFRGEWWPFLSVKRILDEILKSGRKAMIVAGKLTEYLKCCPEQDRKKVEEILTLFP